MTARDEVRADWPLADDVLREVIGGESGDRMRHHVMAAIDDARRELELDPDGFDADRFADERSDHASGGLFPYTFDMAQAWAESIHHVTHEPEADLAAPDSTFDCVVLVMQDIAYRAIVSACERIASEVSR